MVWHKLAVYVPFGGPSSLKSMKKGSVSLILQSAVTSCVRLHTSSTCSWHLRHTKLHAKPDNYISGGKQIIIQKLPTEIVLHFEIKFLVLYLTPMESGLTKAKHWTVLFHLSHLGKWERTVLIVFEFHFLGSILFQTSLKQPYYIILCHDIQVASLLDIQNGPFNSVKNLFTGFDSPRKTKIGILVL